MKIKLLLASLLFFHTLIKTMEVAVIQEEDPILKLATENEYLKQVEFFSLELVDILSDKLESKKKQHEEDCKFLLDELEIAETENKNLESKLVDSISKKNGAIREKTDILRQMSQLEKENEKLSAQLVKIKRSKTHRKIKRLEKENKRLRCALCPLGFVAALLGCWGGIVIE